MDSLFLLKQCNLRCTCTSGSIKSSVWHVRTQKVGEFRICCFAGLEQLDAGGFEAGVTVRREEARGCSCPLLCWQMQEWCQLHGMEGKQESAAENSLSIPAEVCSPAELTPCTAQTAPEGAAGALTGEHWIGNG